MKTLIKHLIKSERGSVLVLAAIGFTVFLGMVALVCDVGLLYLKQNQIAHAMDAAALAGAQELPNDPDKAVFVAKQYAQLNRLDPDGVKVTVAVDNTSLTVSSSIDINLIFARFLGKDNGTVSAWAKAKVAPVNSVNGTVPFSVQDQALQFGQEYVLKEGAGNTSEENGRMNGWFGALDYTGGGGGASEYENLVINGYSGTVSVGDIVDVEHGNMSGPTVDGVEARLNSCNHIPECTWDNFNPDCKKLIYIPVVQPIDSHRVRVVGFAAFFLKGVEGQGNDNSVTGYFVKETISADIDDTSTNYGLQGIKLTN